MDELTLVGADLAMDIDRSNGVRIHGVSAGGALVTRADNSSATSGETSGGGFNAVAWLLTARRVGMLDTRLILTMPDNSTLQLSNINIRAENQDDLHQLRMDVSLPPELGESFVVGADLRGSASDLSNASGNFYIQATNFHSSGVERILKAYQLEIPAVTLLTEQGTNAQVELWGELRKGNVQRISGRTALAQNAIKNDPTGDSLFADVSWLRVDEGGWQFAATDVVVGRVGAEAIFDEIRFGSELDGKFKPQWLSLQTSDTKLLPVINTVNSLMPTALPDGAKAWLSAAEPSAQVRSAALNLSLLSPADSIDLSAQIENVRWNPVGRLPGLQLDTLNVELINGQGQVALPKQGVVIQPPADEAPTPVAGPRPLPAETLLLEQLEWIARIDLPERTMTGSLVTQQASANANVQHTIELLTDGVPYIDVRGEFAASSVLDVKPWLVQAWMPPASRRWLDQALLEGRVENGTLKVLGRADDLSLRGGEGQIQAKFDFQDASLQFLKTWPIATSVNAIVEFDKAKLNSVVIDGRMGNLPIGTANANIEDLFSPTLALALSSETDLKTLVDFGIEGPLESLLKPILDGAVVDGPARLEVSVSTPLRRPPELSEGADSNDVWPVAVNGNVFVKNSNVQLAAVDLPLRQVKGAIGFDNNGIELKGVHASLLGRDVRLHAASTGNGKNRRTDLALLGVLAGEDLLKRFQIPIDQFITGTSSWRADASVPHDPSQRRRNGIALTVTSDLVGTRIAMAEPLGKSSSAALPMRLTTRFKEVDSAPTEAKQTWRLQLGAEDDLQSDTRFTVVGGELEGMIASLEQPLGDRQPESGIRVEGTTGVLSLDGLATDLGTFIDGLPASNAEPVPIMPISINVSAEHMRAGRTRLGAVQLRGNTDEDFVNLFVSNTHLRGSMRYPREHWRSDIEAKVRLNFADKILIDALSNVEVDPSVIPTRLDPRTLPPADIIVGRFEWDKLMLNNLRIRTEPDVSGLRVRTFGFATRSTRLVGEGLWHLVDPQGVNGALADAHTAQLHLTLQSSDLGEALTELGFDGVMAEGEGSVTASLNWPDALYAPGIETVAARATLDLKRGRLLQLEPGAARLVGFA